MSSIALEYRQTSLRRPPEPPAGLDGVIDGWIGRYRRRRARAAALAREAREIDAREEDWKFHSDAALQRHLAGFREVFRRGGRDADAQVPAALAAIREAAERTLSMRPFTVQIMGALALHRGCLAEMATGEGKTLTAALAAVLAGWTRRACHIITVNDYLAQRDARRLQSLYNYCGVSVGCVTAAMEPADRAQGYGRDVTYVTSKEVVADFLRDGLRLGGGRNPTRRLLDRHVRQAGGTAGGLVLRGLHTAIVDEADSVLIDEAVTPLIISSAQDGASLQEMYGVVWEIASRLEPGRDYTVNFRYREIEITAAGERCVAEAAGSLPGRWRGGSRPVELVQQALTAREFFRRGRQYVVDDGKVVIVDEFTGRMMPMRKWRHGLHQAIEAKEGLPISPVDQTLARLSFQRYYRLYQRLSGMTGTAREASAELWSTYRLPVVRIPTNKPVIRRESPDRHFADIDSKLRAVVAEVLDLHRLGRPVLVGTRSVATSEEVAARLREHGVRFNLLNALNDSEEARIVAHAGQRGSITIATNMAGRGTDILLEPGVVELGGLHVIATERHEARRVDRQLFGRAARQGDPGSAVAYVSAEDELLRRFAPAPVRSLLTAFLDRKLPGREAFGRAVSWYVQNRAQGQAAIARRGVMRMDTWLEEAVSFSGSSQL